ncbi:MAG: polysaccharide pyruvyl transferase family protein [Acetatifactor sp.]|nr:polysaccharide pyruvyl transferase family protein [Acetatifactor sp.]
MNIAILTLSASDNCGSLLQAYALQQVLISAGHEVEILDFITKKSKKMYRIFHPSYFKDPKKLIGSFVRYDKLKSQKKDYQDFRNNYLIMSMHKYSSSSDLVLADGKYDLIVCGSDQVWNTDMWDFDDAYLLKWCKISKKAGYAVSLGDKKNERLEGLKEKLAEIDDFFAVSVREKSALIRLNRIYTKNVELCLDPTLLLEYEEWETLTDINVVPQIPFIFYYSFNYGDEIKNQMVALFAAKAGLPVYVINVSRWCDGKEKEYGFKICKRSGPIAFLSLMRYCKFSLVESFHGTLFSYIFQKQFWFLKNSDDNILDDRINDIMEILQTNNRVLHPTDLLEKMEMEMSYEFESTELIKLKNESFNFIASLVN